MEKVDAEFFLKKHRSKIIGGVRNVKSLVDFLTEPQDNKQRFLSDEMASKICVSARKTDQMRELYEHLNCTRGYELTLKWLKKNEPDLLEEIAEKSQTEDEEPVPKRFRSSEGVDETDLNKPSLKIFSTLAKLERWVSDPENSQDLINKLEKKIQTKGLEALREKLKKKKLKKDFCFSADEVRAIEKNKKLSTFFQNLTNAEFPEIVIEMFFQNKAKNDFMPEKDEHSDSDQRRDSGYDSVNNTQFDLANNLSESAALEFTEDKDAQTNEQYMSVIKDVDKSVQHLQSAHGRNDQTQTGKENYTSLERTTGEIQEAAFKPNMHQSEPFQNITAVFLQSEPSSIQIENEGVASLGKCMDMLEPGEPASANRQTPVMSKKRQNPNDSKKKKMKEQRRLLYTWAQKKCSSEENVKKEVLDHISLENIVEHREYPCFTAEDIMIYTDPQTQERQIIYLEEKVCAAKKNLPRDTKIRVNYQMWVCGIEKTLVLMNQVDKEINYESFDAILQCCERLVFEAFAPALAVFKTLQRQEKFYSLFKNH